MPAGYCALRQLRDVRTEHQEWKYVSDAFNLGSRSLSGRLVMNEEQEVIDKLFRLIVTLPRLQRDNVQYIYLSQFGDKIIPFCRRYFANTARADVRVDFLRWVIEYAKNSDEVADFAIEALSDRSEKVRKFACLVLACSDNIRGLPALSRLADHAKQPTLGHARNAILALQQHDWGLFFGFDPSYPFRDHALPMPHDRDQPKDDSVAYYIVKHQPKLVEPLAEIFGNIYGKWRGNKGLGE